MDRLLDLGGLGQQPAVPVARAPVQAGLGMRFREPGAPDPERRGRCISGG